MQLVNRKNLIIAGSVIVLLLIIAGLFAAQQARNNSNDQTTENQDIETVDNNSGETVSDIQGKSPENYGMLPNTPTYLNTEEFITIGITTEQLNSIKYAFYQYATSKDPKIKQVSITKDSAIATTPNADGKSTMNFNVAFDGQPKVAAQIVYFDNSIELTINNPAGTKVFESGTITDKSVYTQ